MSEPVNPQADPTRSSRDRGELRARLTSWLTGRLGRTSDVEIGEVSSPEGSGMSSETLLFDATWTDDTGRHS
ncbi:MAG: phosphotransferase family protein, partial [Acidimicrobiia bacterium]|nr:phosphotransferase family protein [Acidimicrobiia bacterium]